MKKLVTFILALVFLFCCIPFSSADSSLGEFSKDTSLSYKIRDYTPVVLSTLAPMPSLQSFTSIKTSGKTYPTLNMGDSGANVRELQIMLNALGYSLNGIDGNFGEGTYAAITKFQSKNRLEISGSADAATQQLLHQLYDGKPVIPFSTPSPTQSNSRDYVLNKRSLKFHYPYCEWANQISPHNRWDYYGTRESVIRMGYQACKVCRP